MQSAATDTLQGKAIQDINKRWGHGRWEGTETLGITVCKKKYSPFILNSSVDENGEERLTVERMYGCRCHSEPRKALIDRCGPRKGWDSFGQWSITKARQVAREVEREFIIEAGDSISLCSCDLKRGRIEDLSSVDSIDSFDVPRR